MNSVVILSVARHFLTFAGGVVVAFGWVDEETVTQLSGTIMTVVGVLWSFWDKFKTGQLPNVEGPK